MKNLLFLCGVILILPWIAKSQDVEYLSKQDFQAEKTKLLRSIYTLNKANKELKSMLSIEVKAKDSLAQLIDMQAAELISLKEAMNLMESSQTDLDGRLLTQRKSGTLIAILAPVGLFLLILLVLIWFLIFRNRMHSMLNNLNDKWDKLSKRLDEQESTYKREQNSIRSEVQLSMKEADKQFKNFSSETDKKLLNLQSLLEQGITSQDAKHEESHKEYEAFKGGLKKGYDTISSDLTSLKEELASTAKDLSSRLKEIIQKNSD
ncbi:hypothetical protein ACFLS7_00505 [Bacteroidota bacterium]